MTAELVILPVIREDRYEEPPLRRPRRSPLPPPVAESWTIAVDGLLARFARDWAGDAALSVTELVRVAHRQRDLDDAALARNRAPLAAMRRLLDEAVRRADRCAEERRQARRAAADQVSQADAEAEEACHDRD